MYEEDSYFVIHLREPRGGEHGVLLLLSVPIHPNLRLTDEEEPTVPTLPVLLHSVQLPAVLSARRLECVDQICGPAAVPCLDTEPVDGVHGY